MSKRELKALDALAVGPGDVVRTAYRGGVREGVSGTAATVAALSWRHAALSIVMRPLLSLGTSGIAVPVGWRLSLLWPVSFLGAACAGGEKAASEGGVHVVPAGGARQGHAGESSVGSSSPRCYVRSWN